jgi:hypothetical protein
MDILNVNGSNVWQFDDISVTTTLLDGGRHIRYNVNQTYCFIDEHANTIV